jgi:hypothetical protein
MGFSLVATVSGSAVSDSKTEPEDVKQVNALVAAIDGSLKKGEYPSLDIDEKTESEGKPPSFKLYYDPSKDRLAAAVVSVGHETWLNEFRYYYYPDGKPMKYTKTTKDRPDNPPKQAVIFDKRGKVLWKNTDAPRGAADEIFRFFNKLEEMRKVFVEY